MPPASGRVARAAALGRHQLGVGLVVLNVVCFRPVAAVAADRNRLVHHQRAVATLLPDAEAAAVGLEVVHFGDPVASDAAPPKDDAGQIRGMNVVPTHARQGLTAAHVSPPPDAAPPSPCPLRFCPVSAASASRGASGPSAVGRVASPC